jgi:hypothetical protein
MVRGSGFLAPATFARNDRRGLWSWVRDAGDLTPDPFPEGKGNRREGSKQLRAMRSVQHTFLLREGEPQGEEMSRMRAGREAVEREAEAQGADDAGRGSGFLAPAAFARNDRRGAADVGGECGRPNP